MRGKFYFYCGCSTDDIIANFGWYDWTCHFYRGNILKAIKFLLLTRIRWIR